jgi:hypothetical protein
MASALSAGRIGFFASDSRSLAGARFLNPLQQTHAIVVGRGRSAALGRRLARFVQHAIAMNVTDGDEQ